NLRNALLAAYGVTMAARDALDVSFDMSTDRYQSFADGLSLQPPIATKLAEALGRLLDQALSWQFPKHPDFGVELKRRDLERVLVVLGEAHRSSDPSLLVEDKKLRPLLRQIADPLGTGKMGEDRYRPSREWREHFFRQKTRAGRDRVTVADLRAWTDEPEPRGLPADVQDLLAILYAAETTATFQLHGRPEPGEIGKLRPEMELRPVPLPSKDDWEAAQKVAAALCGVSGSKLLDAENVATLASGVRRVVDPERKASFKLPDEIRHRLGWLGMGDAEIESAARLQTAVAVAKLAAKLEQCEEDASLVHTLAKAEIATSGS